MKQHPRISAFRRFIEGWYLSYFTPDAARSLPLAGPQKHLNIHGDIPALKKAYPKAKDAVLNTYVNDSICGTWEKLADAIFPGGSAVLSTKGWQAIGAEKSLWAEKITPHMDVNNNASPSFGYLRTKMMELAGIIAT